MLPPVGRSDSPVRSVDVREEHEAVVIQATRGNVVVLGWNQTRVRTSIRSWPKDFRNQIVAGPSEPGAQSVGFEGSLSILEKSNRVAIRFQADKEEETLFVWIPVDRNLKVSALGGGSVAVRGTKGEVDVQSLQGKILLDQIWGPVVAHALNEELWVRFAALVVSKPNYLSSLNGNVTVILPEGADASFELDFFNGEVDTSIPITLVPGTNVWAADGSTVFEPSRAAETTRKATHFRIKNHNGNIIIKDYESKN